MSTGRTIAVMSASALVKVFMSPTSLLGLEGLISFCADPIGVDVTLSCLHNIF